MTARNMMMNRIATTTPAVTAERERERGESES